MTAAPKPRPGTLAARAEATGRTIAHFAGVPFSWEKGNCWRLTAYQARVMGHSFPPVPRFRSPLGAVQALRKAGCTCAADFLDRHFQRLPAASMALIGDLVLLPSEDGVLDAVCIADGQGNLFGWHGEDPSGLKAIKFASADVIGAWRL